MSNLTYETLGNSRTTADLISQLPGATFGRVRETFWSSKRFPDTINGNMLIAATQISLGEAVFRLLVVFVVFAAVVVTLAVCVASVRNAIARKLKAFFGDRAERSLQFHKQVSLLTAAERDFYLCLREVIPSDIVLFVKVRLADVVGVTQPFGQAFNRAAFATISQKHCDFVLCRELDFSIVLVIELDDSTHQRKDRQKADLAKDTALDSAGIPKLRFKCRRSYDLDEIRFAVQRCLNGESAETPP